MLVCKWVSAKGDRIHASRPDSDGERSTFSKSGVGMAGKARQASERPGVAGEAELGRSRPVDALQAWRGEARLGIAGTAWLGLAGCGPVSQARRGLAWSGMARRGVAGEASHLCARPVQVRQARMGNRPRTAHITRKSPQMIDCSAIAKKFGGGGHKNAAGFKAARY